MVLLQLGPARDSAFKGVKCQSGLFEVCRDRTHFGRQQVTLRLFFFSKRVNLRQRIEDFLSCRIALCKFGENFGLPVRPLYQGQADFQQIRVVLFQLDKRIFVSLTLGLRFLAGDRKLNFNTRISLRPHDNIGNMCRVNTLQQDRNHILCQIFLLAFSKVTCIDLVNQAGAACQVQTLFELFLRGIEPPGGP